MGVTKELPPVKLFDGTLSKHAYKKINNETVEEYDDEVKKLFAYSNNAKTKKHYQRYENQYQDYTKNHSKLKLDSS
eukprot:12224232-Ditylum_brightwellii.AAC.1